MPVRLLIGPGLILVGVGLLLMRGLNAGSAWTHLIPGMILGGIGVGLVNPPLASTAVGVVRPQQAGMASGINSTFRQVGIATGIALLGTLFSSQVKSEVVRQVAGRPAWPTRARRSPPRSSPARSASSSPSCRRRPGRPIAQITRGAFASGLNRILLIAAIIALASGVLSLLLIRGKDFAAPQLAPKPAPKPPADPAAQRPSLPARVPCGGDRAPLCSLIVGLLLLVLLAACSSSKSTASPRITRATAATPAAPAHCGRGPQPRTRP